MKPYRKLVNSLLVVGCVAALGTAALVGSRSSFREEQYRDTANLLVEDLSWDPDANGYRVSGTLFNRDRRHASSVVLLAEIRDDADNVLAANPLINVLDVPPSQRAPFEAIVPGKVVPGAAKASARAVVVRWGQ